MSKWKVFLYILEWIIALSSLVGWIYSLISGAHKFFGIIEMGPFEWYLIFQASVIVVIVINWVHIVRLWKRITGETKREQRTKEEKTKLDNIISLIEENRKFIRRKIESDPAMLEFSNMAFYNEAKMKIELELLELGFVLPSDEEEKHEKFDVRWYSFLTALKVNIEKGIYKDYPNLWKELGSPYE